MTEHPNHIPALPRVTARTWLLLLALVVVAAALRWPLLDDPVWFDEACMSAQRLGRWEQLAAVVYVDIHPPLFTSCMHLWNRWFGDGELAMRIPAMITGLLSIPLLWLVGRRLAGDRAALWAAALLAVTPAPIWYSAEARLYAPMVCCALLAVWSFHRLAATPGRSSRLLWALHFGNVAVMLSLHYYLALYVVLLAVLAPVATGRLGRRAGLLLLGHGLGILLLAAFVYTKQRLGEFETSQAYLSAMSPQHLYELLFPWAFTGGALDAAKSPLLHGVSRAYQGFAVLLVTLGLVHLARRRRARPGGLALPLYALAIPGFLLGSALLGLDATYIERSCLPALPFLFLIAGAGMALLPRRLHLCAGVALGLFATGTLGAFFAYRDTHWTVYKPDPDWRAAARWLGAEIDAGAAGRPVFTNMPYPRSLPYYDSRIQDEKGLLPGTDPEAIGQKVGDKLGAWFGELAARTFRGYDDHNARLLREAELRTYRCTGRIDELRLDERLRTDDVAYLIRNEWYPPDPPFEALLTDARTEPIEQVELQGLTIYKVKIRR